MGLRFENEQEMRSAY